MKKIFIDNNINIGNILFVGGNGPGNYTDIQSAVDDAVNGDIIFIYSGLYYEYDIHIDKSISIIGEDKDITIIDGNENDVILYFDVNDISIEQLTIRNSDFAAIRIYSDNNAVSDCIFSNQWRAIFVCDSYDDKCNNNLIKNCQFYDNHWAIQIMGWDDIVTDNIIDNCTFGQNNSVTIHMGDNHIVSNCIFIEGFLRFEVLGSNNAVFGCEFINPFRDGISLSADGVNNRIENCVIRNASSDGIYVPDVQYGLQIINCTITNSGMNNILLYASMRDCKILDCIIEDAFYNGVYFYVDYHRCEVSRCHFEGNDAGIKIAGSSFFNHFNQNNFINNRRTVLPYITIISIQLNFYEGNYFDDWRGTGPYHIYRFFNWDFNPASEPYDIEM